MPATSQIRPDRSLGHPKLRNSQPLNGSIRKNRNAVQCYAMAALLTIHLLAVVGCESQTQWQGKNQYPAYHIDQAHHYLEEGLTDSALAAFGLAIEENPKVTEAHLGMGHIYRQRGRYARATRSYELATALDPNSFDAHYFLGLTHQLTGQLTDAVTMFLRSLVIDPGRHEANYRLGSVYLQLGQPAEALPYAAQATRLDGQSQAAWANLGAAYSLLGQYEQAVEAYRQANELGEPEEPILASLADAQIKLGRYPLAISVLQRLIREGGDSIAHERLGYCHFKQRRYEQARASYQAALDIDPDDTASLNGLGASLMTLYIQDHHRDRVVYERALRSWRRSVQLRNDQPRIIDLIARYQRM